MIEFKDFTRLSPYLWEIPQSYRADMLVPARVYASEEMLKAILDEKAIWQLVNMTTLPGIIEYALAMPDVHQGYGFPIGGVAAMRVEDGVISPGGVGYDINCGVRLIKTPYQLAEIKDKLEQLASQMQRDVPSGVGRGGYLQLKGRELDAVLNHGVNWAEKNGYAFAADAECIEESGAYAIADAALVSDKAKKRGADQIGTLGAGNHFIEVQQVVDVIDEKIANAFGLYRGQLTVMIHTGSRGLGHQVCTDYVAIMLKSAAKYGLTLPDRELICAPFRSPEGQQYFAAMAAAANFAWVNRQLITHNIRNVWQRVIGAAPEQLSLLYDVAHNVAKVEKHSGQNVVMHRKGATRAFGPGHPDLPPRYQTTGQPVIIPGSMGTHSYVLVGTATGMEQAFGSTCHGAGRRLSRAKAKKTVAYTKLRSFLDEYGVVVRAGSAKGLVEEAPQAYKDIEQVVDVVVAAGIANKVVKLKPVAIIKG